MSNSGLLFEVLEWSNMSSSKSVLLVEETGVPGENQWPVASHWQTCSHNVAHLALIEIRTYNISGDRHTGLIYLYTCSRLKK
jgi:hypothetical protein